MSRCLRVHRERWPLARAFAISRGAKIAAEVVVAEISDGALVGRGECVPYARYGETPAAVAALVEEQAPAIAAGLDHQALQARLPAGAARNALDCALWDLEAKAAGRRVWDIAGLPAPVATVTAETIGLATPEQMAAAAALLAAADRPLIKLKLDRDAIVARVQAVRAAAPAARLIVDANEAWDRATLAAVVPALAALGVEVIEQPLPAADDDALAGYRGPVALCADESLHTTADVARLADGYRMVNVKLDKAGGLSEALACVRAARAAGLGVMLGCMVATSLAMAPALLLAAAADIVDLDGPLWLAEDRPHALTYRDGRVFPPAAALWG